MSRFGAKSDINITPLIDIVLVLLIVFIVLVPTLAKVSNASLPQRQDTPTQEPPQPPLVVSLDAQGQLFLQQDSVAWDELREVLVAPLLLQPCGARKVFLKVSGDLPNSTAVRAMDEIRAASAQVYTKSGVTPEQGGSVKVVVSLKKA